MQIPALGGNGVPGASSAVGRGRRVVRLLVVGERLETVS